MIVVVGLNHETAPVAVREALAFPKERLAEALAHVREETGLEVAFAGPIDDAGVPELAHVDVHEGGRGHTHLDLRYLIDGGDADPRAGRGAWQSVVAMAALAVAFFGAQTSG